MSDMAVRASARRKVVAEDPLAEWRTTREEAHAIFEEESQRLMGMSREEFLRRWDADEFDIDGQDHTKLISLYFLMPFGRA